MLNRDCTGVILAGGENKRFAGTDKAFERVGEMAIFEHIYGIFRDLFAETLLVTNRPEKFLDWDITMAADLLDFRSSLTACAESGLTLFAFTLRLAYLCWFAAL